MVGPYPEAKRRRHLWRAEPEAAEDAASEPTTLLGGVPKGPPEGYGISFSGGGIRAASYALGVLQEMHRHDMVTGPRKARWMSAVSGGSYLLGGVASVARGPVPADQNALPLSGEAPARPGLVDGRPFATGTPEELYLRNHTRYLTRVSGGLPGAIWRLLLGILINVGLLELGIHAVARPVGWVYGWVVPQLRVSQCAYGVCQAVPWHVDHWGAVLNVVLGLAVAAVVFGIAWVAFALPWPDRQRRWVGALSIGFAAATLGVLAATLGIVSALHVLRTTIGNQVPASSSGVVRGGAQASAHGLHVVTTGFLTAAVGLVVTAVGGVRHVTAQGGEATTLLRRFRGPMLNLAATLFGPALIILSALLFVSWGAATPPWVAGGGGVAEVVKWAIPTAVLVAAWFLFDVNSWSLHPLYQRGLSLAFMQKRVTAVEGSPTAVDGQDATERPWDEPYPLSLMQPDALPEVLICAAANITDYGATPAGFRASSFVFSAKVVGGPIVGALDTGEYERLVSWRKTDVTLPSAVAIAGAAFSPEMGKMTRAPLRFILALTNLRLGVWIPNPRRVHGLHETYGGDIPARVRPRPGYLLCEMFGWDRLNARFLYVTDGGHYENLGLVELLRRKCKWIWTVDAAGDAVDTFSTIGQAMALAASELDVRIDLNPESMAPDRDATGERLVKKPYCVGTIYYPDGSTGTLVFIKAGVSGDAPWEVRAYHQKHPRFPCDPTTDQFYNGDQFDAYRELGSFAMAKAWEDVGGEFDVYRSTVSKSSGT